ncbi:hypothetical protein [Aquimarina sp. I32.4]|uniref:hypothetical protein n=1 Tax=Aquimarina sp. I32.4 TaxID=2053903 RepID=UPI000CDE8952|nr:hypothetical protein [Aquimarina sp. I32.4]
MKIFHTYFIILSVIFFACQQEESPDEPEQKQHTLNWKTATPKKAFGTPENGFNIPREALEEALKLPNVSTVRFILEIENKQLQIRVAGTNPNGDITKGIVANSISTQEVVTKLFAEKHKRFEISALSKSVASHILQPDEAVDFVSAWQQKWQSNTLEEAIAYDEQRIQYFSLPATVILHMLQNSLKSVNLVWGVNPKGKFTTVFLPELGKKQSLLKSGDFIYEYSSPCPPTCTPPID